MGLAGSSTAVNQGKFHLPGIRQGSELETTLSTGAGLPWQRVGAGCAIALL